jgi:NAD(P)-dependent dehydrogenase (short-subunit alcohol dehydrogenase family)
VLQSSTGKSASADGLELSFATNTLGAFHLTRLLEPVLKRSAPSRVVFVSSGGMYIGAGLTSVLSHDRSCSVSLADDMAVCVPPA